ncbi:MAG: T9SS type A sorting domain-containing protein [Candidatus Marinimicrobia bacterium]|nr:T9SS type A sorting domain-containing protein [Candidatus Neomarinimicrobiota bacterium]
MLKKVFLIYGLSILAIWTSLTGADLTEIKPSGIVTMNYGQSVAIEGNYAVVSSWRDRIASIQRGSVYIYYFDGSSWSLQQRLISSDGEYLEHFGYSVSISGDYVAIGAFGDDGSKGSVYIFVRNGTNWTEQQKLVASDGAAGDYFGHSVSIDGNTVIIGAEQDDSNKGSAYIFTQNGTTWQEQAKLVASDGATNDEFGCSVSIKGDNAVVGAWNVKIGNFLPGAAYVFSRSGNTWSQQAKLLAPDRYSGDYFGRSVAIDNNFIAIGSPKDDDGGSSSGSVYLFVPSGLSYIFQTKLIAYDDETNDQFGWSVALSENTLLIGSNGDDDKGSGSGSAYLYTFKNGAWTFSDKLLAPNGTAGDYFGMSVAISDGKAVIGAPFKNSNVGSAYITSNLDNSLPVELSGFTAIQKQSAVVLSWTTESELNNLGFNIYKSTKETGDFVKINEALIQGAGNSTVQNKYTYIDAEVISGMKYFYQIEDVAQDGKTEKHDIISIMVGEEKLDKVSEFQLSNAYPNPFNPATTIEFDIPKESLVELTIYDLQGNILETLVNENKTVGHYKVNWNAENYPSGIYLYHLKAAHYSSIKKCILVK